MEKNGNLILTGWGYAEYVASAAVALKALGGRADVYGVSRRCLPKFLGELAKEHGMPHWKCIYLLGLSLSGDPESLYATTARYLAGGVRPAAWEPDVRSAVEHYGHKPRLAAPRGRR